MGEGISAAGRQRRSTRCSTIGHAPRRSSMFKTTCNDDTSPESSFAACNSDPLLGRRRSQSPPLGNLTIDASTCEKKDIMAMATKLQQEIAAGFAELQHVLSECTREPSITLDRGTDFDHRLCRSRADIEPFLRSKDVPQQQRWKQLSLERHGAAPA